MPTDTAIYLLNYKRQNLTDLENKYKMSIIISADNEIKMVSDYRIERVKTVKVEETSVEEAIATTYSNPINTDDDSQVFTFVWFAQRKKINKKPRKRIKFHQLVTPLVCVSVFTSMACNWFNVLDIFWFMPDDEICWK